MLNAQWGLIFWTLVTFGISAFILWKFVFIPLQRVIDERRSNIQESIDTASETRKEAAQLLEEYKETLARVRAEADEIVENAKRAGEETRNEVVTGARTEAERLVGRAHDQIERDTQAALQKLRDEVSDLTLLAAEKVVGRSLTPADHKRLVEEALEEALKQTHLDDLELGLRG
jgi:F-type H+-transporting ATPase subunit b